jgi:serine phosphatase RsbU (regulator of sigma subunit)
MGIAYLQEEPSPRILCYRKACSIPCAGDVVDVFPCGDGSATILIADVCGRDARAEDHAGFLRHAVRELADDRSPAHVLERVNRAFARRVAAYKDDRFASVFTATLKRRCLTYASAGHDFALLIDGDGNHRHLPATGTIVGIAEAQGYGERAFAVAPGDWLVLVTDGITDARDAHGTFFGTTGVVRNALAAIRAGLDDPAAAILAAAHEHARGRFVDDASALCVSVS